MADDEVIARIANEGWTEFDVALAVPDMMRKIGRLGKVLGRKGLMPNPKAGTLIPPEDIPRAIEEARAGRIEFRNDKTANIHVPIGKVSFRRNSSTARQYGRRDGRHPPRPPLGCQRHLCAPRGIDHHDGAGNPCGPEHFTGHDRLNVGPAWGPCENDTGRRAPSGIFLEANP